MRWRLLIVSVVVLLTAGLAEAGPALAQPGASNRPAATTPTATPIYAFNSGSVLTGGAATSGARVTDAVDQASSGQRWLLESDGTIRLAADPDLCLDVPAYNYTSRVQLDVWTCHNGSNQQFLRTAPSGSSPVLAIAPEAHPSLCLNVSGGLFAGAPVILYACGPATTNYVNEAWSTTNLAATTNEITSPAGLPLNVSRGGGAGAAAIAWPDSATLNEYWQTSTVTISGYGPELQFRPVYDTSLCLSTQGPESLRAALVLASCAGTAVQAFAGIRQSQGAFATYFIAAHDARYCLNVRAGAAPGHPVILFTCEGTGGNDLWATNLDLDTAISEQFGTLALNGTAFSSSSQPVLQVPGPAAGAFVVAESNGRYPAYQVWTDFPPAGATGDPGPGTVDNPDGSISLRPLADVSLCLTTAGSGAPQPYAGLQVEPCAGESSQEFLRLPSPVGGDDQELVPYSDQQLCLAGPAEEAHDPTVELDPCGATGSADATNQDWSAFPFGWSSWGGQPAS